jgi:pSer/pThr/pTyr-binding forkhead associated (FHA) protein
VLASPRVSRRHCVVRARGGKSEIEDLGSANASFMNGVRGQRLPLHDGDMVEVAGCALVFMREAGRGLGRPVSSLQFTL